MTILPKVLGPRGPKGSNGIRVPPALVEAGQGSVADALERLQTTPKGLSQEQAEQRLEQHGPNVVAQEQRHSGSRLLGHALSTRW